MFCLLQKEGGKRRSKGEFILKTKKAPEKNSPTMRYKEEKQKHKGRHTELHKITIKAAGDKAIEKFLKKTLTRKKEPEVELN